MILTIYKRALAVLAKKPFALWGISLLKGLLVVLAQLLFGTVAGVAMAIVLLLDTSMTLIFLHGYRGDEVHCVQLFDCFKDGKTFKRVLGGMAWMELWIFLWSLIPVVGIVFGMIRSYQYRLTPYILMQEPEISPTEAIKRSTQMTQGYKGKMFGADILIYVALWVAVLLLGLLAQIPYVGVLFLIVAVLLLLCAAVLLPLFLGLVQAAFYEEITNPTPVALPYGGTASFCPHCGTPLAPGSAFCPNCGTRLS